MGLSYFQFLFWKSKLELVESCFEGHDLFVWVVVGFRWICLPFWLQVHLITWTFASRRWFSFVLVILEVRLGDFSCTLRLASWAMWPSSSATSLSAIRTFYNVAPEVWQAFVDSAGDPADDLKAMASLPPALLATCVTAARLPSGAALTTVQASQVGLVFRAARRNLFLQAGGDPAQWRDPNPWEATSLTSSSTSPTAAGSQPVERKMKFVNVLDQADASEFNVIDDKAHAKLMGNFVNLTGGLPAVDEEPTREQLSALHRKVFVLNQPPYADFAVFTPHNKKFLKAMKYRTFLPTMEGGYMAKEVPGPATYSQWLGSFRVWRTAMLMLEILDLALIQRYELLVENMVKQLPGCWHLIVSAEDRARSDQLARFQMQATLNLSIGEPVPRGWVDNRPCWGPTLSLVN